MDSAIHLSACSSIDVLWPSDRTICRRVERVASQLQDEKEASHVYTLIYTYM